MRNSACRFVIAALAILSISGWTVHCVSDWIDGPKAPMKAHGVGLLSPPAVVAAPEPPEDRLKELDHNISILFDDTRHLQEQLGVARKAQKALRDRVEKLEQQAKKEKP